MKPEYERVLAGEQRYDDHLKSQKLDELSQEATQCHLAVKEQFRGTLEYAKRAGDALRVAKKILGGRSKWGKWLGDETTGSRRRKPPGLTCGFR